MVARAVVMVMLAAAVAGCAAAQRPVLDGGIAAGPAPPGAAVASSAGSVLAAALAGELPRAATDPPALARQITVAETAVRAPASSPAVVAAAGRTAQVAYLALLDRSDWDSAVLVDVPAPVQDTVRRTVAAGRELRSMSPRPPTTVPAWRVVEPLAAPQLRGYYAEAQRRFGVPWSVLAAVHLVETRMGRIVGYSTAGAQGPMQFLPATWARYGLGGNVWDTRDAILGAANYLAAEGGAEGTDAGLDNALFRYNNDARYGRAVRNYAALMQADERAFVGLHAWQVYYRTSVGEVLLPIGYASTRRIPVQQWLATRPR